MHIELEATDLLIAPPGLHNDRFEESVIMLINHVDDMGTIGLCMNRPLDLRLPDIIDTYPEVMASEDIYWGGPVQPHTLWLLHTSDWSIENTIEISQAWSITSHESMFEEIESGNAPEIMRLYMGYCSWDVGQLESELAGTPPFTKEEAWLVSTYVNTEDILDTESEYMWEQACEIACAQAVDRVL